MTTTEPPHRPDRKTALAMLTAWRAEGPDLEHPDGYSTEGLRDLLNVAAADADPWDVILGLVALSGQLLTYLAESSESDADAILATIAQVDAEREGGEA